MKLKALLFSVMLVLVLPMLSGASEVEIPGMTYDAHVDVSFTNDENLSILHQHLDVLPDSIEILIPDFEVAINTANNQFILYSYLKQTPIPSGNILRLHYTNITQNTAFTLTTLGATDVDATQLYTMPEVTGEIRLYFLQQDVDDTANRIVGNSASGGVDFDEDGTFNPLDLQNVINGQQ